MDGVDEISVENRRHDFLAIGVHAGGEGYIDVDDVVEDGVSTEQISKHAVAKGAIFRHVVVLAVSAAGILEFALDGIHFQLAQSGGPLHLHVRLHPLPRLPQFGGSFYAAGAGVVDAGEADVVDAMQGLVVFRLANGAQTLLEGVTHVHVRVDVILAEKFGKKGMPALHPDVTRGDGNVQRRGRGREERIERGASEVHRR